jgi:ComF family protein
MSIFGWASPLQLLEKAAACAGQNCVLCAGRAAPSLVCAACEARLPRCADASPCVRDASLAFDDAAAAFDYRFPVDRLVQRFKFGGDLAVGRWLALQLAQRVVPLAAPALLVAPPLTPSRLRGRGFNQALEIAKVVGREIGVRTDLDGLAKVRETTPQPSLGGRARRANLRGAFACRLALAGEHVAIVDDVLTTGATAAALARALKDAGAGRVSVWAVARTPAPRR